MPKASKLQVAENALKIRQYLIDGLNQHQITFMMKIDPSTYQRYLKNIYEEDAQMLSEKKERALASDIMLYKNRLEKALTDLNILYNDRSASAKERVEIIKTRVAIAEQLLKVDSEGTTLLRLKPELQAMIDQSASLVRNKIQIYNIHNNIQEKDEKNKPIIIKPNEEEF